MDKNINTPLITVFMAVFNGEAYIEKAIESVLNQSFTDFELLIVNDGSTDQTLDVIGKFNDPRIRLVNNDGNKGLTFTRNRGVEEAKGQYIAILDSDDIAMPDRLKLQSSFFNSNPEIAICGGQAIIIDESGQQTGSLNVMVGDKNMSPELVFHNIFINSTLMIKRSSILEVGGYRDLLVAEDYDLSYRISLKHPVANLDQVLAKYRLHGNNISKIQDEKLVAIEFHIIKTIYTNLGLSIDENLIRIHHDYFTYQFASRSAKEFLLVFEALKKGNSKAENYAIQTFNEMLFKKWFSLLRDKQEKKIIPLYFKNALFEWPLVTFKQLRRVFKQMLFLNLFTKRR